jgi:hypothetical protein
MIGQYGSCRASLQAGTASTTATASNVVVDPKATIDPKLILRRQQQGSDEACRPIRMAHKQARSAYEAKPGGQGQGFLREAGIDYDPEA